ncbi:NAD(P)/FAD-dependent oxidoreductase [Halobacillus halophilus]|uniref:NAD(P)/FAD-dependent oxidoreductase n=1 Tax=Halobacillus halophilus TaxID=1570 RepID=UPI001CD2E5BC|nr:NAD(P)/FAD-dependent oxidoreductase [Halobacillus halophilus]MCA1009568.1 NAD(P)/FAD-dependent oxidoreductase [Halobacillus halophilus]
MKYDCIIIGGGIAGLQASIQLGRYKRSVLLIDAEDGRSSLCRKYSNILGFPNGVSGQELRKAGRQHAENLGVSIRKDRVKDVHKNGREFTVYTVGGGMFSGKNLLLATGLKDHIPSLPGVKPCLGLSVYVCPDCDGYEVMNQRTAVIGSGNAGASMAISLLYWSRDILFINHELEDISPEWTQRLATENIEVITAKVKELHEIEGSLNRIEMKDGESLHVKKAFLAFGGNQVRTELAVKLGAEISENHHLIIDPKTKMTSVPNLWASGDVAAHSELVTAAMGEGSLAAIWIHKELLKK